MTSPTAQHTDFTKDVLGRYVCNGLDEAIASTSGVDGRPFDIVIIGGGSFGSVLALQTLSRDRFRNHRILVLDAGPYVLPEHVQNLPCPRSGPSPARDGRPRRGPGRGVGTPVAVERAHRLPRARLLPRRSLDVLGRVVGGADRSRDTVRCVA